MMSVRLSRRRLSLVWTYLAAGATFCLALYVVWMLGLLAGKPADQIRKLTKGQLIKEAFSGDEALPIPAARPAPEAVLV